MSTEGPETDRKYPANTLKADEAFVIVDGPDLKTTVCEPQEARWETIHALGPEVRALDEVLEEALEHDETWAKARADAGADGAALERAMRCAVQVAREHSACTDGPLEWVKGWTESEPWGHPEFTPMLNITMLGDVARTTDLNEALADALAADDEALHAAMKHRMIMFRTGPTMTDTTKRAEASTENDSGTSARADQDRDWIERLMAGGPRGAQAGQKLARAIVHPWCYRRAAAEDDEHGWDDAGWRALYRIMVLATEQWCHRHQKKARRIASTMTIDDMLWLSYKEKWGSMRWEVHTNATLPRSLHRALMHMEWILEVVSARTCQWCGRASHIRKPGQTNNGRIRYGWVNNVCDQCHRRHHHDNRQRDNARWGSGHDEYSTRGDKPPSKAEADVETDRYLASLQPDHDEFNPWAYAVDVVDEWKARNASDREKQREAWPGPEVSYSLQSTPPVPEPTTYRVRVGRWRYEEGEVTVEALDGEDAAAKAREADPQWRESAQTSGAFVLGVGSAQDTAQDTALSTALRIEEHHGETAMLKAVLTERTESARARARTAQAERERTGD